MTRPEPVGARGFGAYADFHRKAGRVVLLELRLAVREWIPWLLVAQLSWFAILALQEPAFFRERAAGIAGGSLDVGAAAIYGLAIAVRASTIGRQGLVWLVRVTGRAGAVVVGLSLAWWLACCAVEYSVAIVRSTSGTLAGLVAPADWMGGVGHHARMLAIGAVWAAFGVGLAALARNLFEATMIWLALIGLSLAAADTPIPLRRILRADPLTDASPAWELLLPVLAAVACGLAVSGWAVTRLLCRPSPGR